MERIVINGEFAICWVQLSIRLNLLLFKYCFNYGCYIAWNDIGININILYIYMDLKDVSVGLFEYGVPEFYMKDRGKPQKLSVRIAGNSDEMRTCYFISKRLGHY